MRKNFQLFQIIVVVTMVLLASLLLTFFTRNYIKDSLTQQILKDNKILGEQIVKRLENQNFSSWPKERQQDHLQSLCETMKLPNGGFICATSPSGELIALPGLQKGEKKSMSSMNFSDAGTGTNRAFGSLQEGESATGLLTREDTTDIVATLMITGTNMRLLVHQNRPLLNNKLRPVTYPILLVGLSLALLLSFISYKLSSALINKYENKLETNNKLLRTVNEELQLTSRQRELYYQGFSYSAGGIVITDEKGVILHTNRAFTMIYGYSETEICGRTPHIFNPGKEVYRDLGYSEQQYDALFQEIWTSVTSPEIGYWEGEIPNITKDGTIIWAHLLINAIKDETDTITNYIGVEYDLTKHRNEEFQIRLEIYDTINQIAEMRDNETGRHLIRVSKYCKLIAQQLGLPKKFCDDIERFSPLHDIGKVGIPDAILLAPRQLTDDEFKVIKCHPYYGYQILAGKTTMEMGADIAYCHHEKFDGTGYPRMLKGEEIPLSARIVALADVYDALRSKRPYKEPWEHTKVRDVIERNSEEHFDPNVVNAFLTLEEQFEAISIELQDTDEDISKLTTPSVAQANSILAKSE